MGMSEYAADLTEPTVWTEAVADDDLIWRRATPTGDGLTEEIEYLVPRDTLQPLRFFRLKVQLME